MYKKICDDSSKSQGYFLINKKFQDLRQRFVFIIIKEKTSKISSSISRWPTNIEWRKFLGAAAALCITKTIQKVRRLQIPCLSRVGQWHHSLLRDLRDYWLSLFLLTKNIYVGDSKILMLMLMAIPKYVCMYACIERCT